MIQLLDDMPAGVIGFEASGKLEADDYRTVILPALVEAAESGEVRKTKMTKEKSERSSRPSWPPPGRAISMPYFNYSIPKSCFTRMMPLSKLPQSTKTRVLRLSKAR